MATHYNTRIVTDNLVLNLDAGNTKSYAGDITYGTDYGYFGGGHPGPVTTVDRVDYGNDTATAAVKGPLSLARRFLAATGNASYGYFAGGWNPSISTVDRLDYSSDTSTAAAKGPLSAGRLYLGATGNTSYGYIGGGQPGSPGYSTVDRIDYSNDTATAVAKGPLSQARFGSAATGNTSYGYFGGGHSGVAVTTVDRVDYSNDTATAASKGPLSVARHGLAATGNTSYGYFGGGNPGTKSTVDRIDYSSDTGTTPTKGPLSVGRYVLAATGNTSYGYFGGGNPGPVSTVDRIDYSSDTPTAAAKGPLSAARYGLAAASSRANGLPTTETRSASAPQGTNYGYITGGGTGTQTSVDRIDYDNDTAIAVQKGPLSAGAGYMTGVGNLSYAYQGGGFNSGVKSSISRMDYSNDTATSVSGKGPLSLARRAPSATGNADYGYFGGGNLPSPATVYSTIDRLDYSSDTTTAAVKGPLTVTRTTFAATGNTSYGYFGGAGYYPGPQLSSVDRVDYSSDTPTASPKGPLTAVRGYLTATGSASYGYFAGGFSYPPSARYSTIERIDYSSDTPTAVAKGPLTDALTMAGAVSSASYGYFAGGGLPANRSTVDRIDYSNDTPTATTKGPLSEAKNSVSSVSSRDYGLPTSSTTYPWYDTSGKGDDGENTSGGATYGSGGGGSFTFNGSSNYVSSDDKSNLQLGAGNFTLAAWIKPGSPQSNNQGIISYSDSSGEENDTTCQFDVNSDGKIRFTGAAGIVTSTSAPTVGAWSHAAITRADNTISVYINGVLENTGITTHTFSDYAKVTIGANRPRSTFYKGDISQVQIYKGKALSSDEVQQNFNALRSRFGV